MERLQADSDAGTNEKFEWFYVWQAWTDHLVWAYALLFHGFAFVLYSLSLFMVSAALLSQDDEVTHLPADYNCRFGISELASTAVSYITTVGSSFQHVLIGFALAE